MVDFITLINSSISDNEAKQIIERLQLQTNSRGNRIYYDNMNTKDIIDGYYIRIETNRGVKLELSLHKYRNWLEGRGYVNDDLFSMDEARQTIKDLKEKTGLPINQMKVYNYEIGMNLFLKQNCRSYMDQVESIGIHDQKRSFYINPKYKDQRLKTTYFYREIRKVFKIYDKQFEMKEKRRKEYSEHSNTLRIETVNKRVEGTTIEKLFSPDNINKLADQFLRDWRTVQFRKIIVAKKGTPSARKELCKEILKHGTQQVLQTARERLQKKDITEKQFRRIREFINNDWDLFKHEIYVLQSDEEKEFRKVLNHTHSILK